MPIVPPSAIFMPIISRTFVSWLSAVHGSCTSTPSITRTFVLSAVQGSCTSVPLIRTFVSFVFHWRPCSRSVIIFVSFVPPFWVVMSSLRLIVTRSCCPSLVLCSWRSQGVDRSPSL